jgi:hypothetical protein
MIIGVDEVNKLWNWLMKLLTIAGISHIHILEDNLSGSMAFLCLLISVEV